MSLACSFRDKKIPATGFTLGGIICDTAVRKQGPAGPALHIARCRGQNRRRRVIWRRIWGTLNFCNYQTATKSVSGSGIRKQGDRPAILLSGFEEDGRWLIYLKSPI